jgi:hypothetical protein
MAGGITYAVAKPVLATVTENGVDPSDPRVLQRTNEAIQRILGFDFITVGGMLTVDVTASGTTLLLPKELENAIEVEVLGGATVNNQTDVTQGWVMVNQFAYIDPSAAHDNPLVDQFFVPDPNDSTILRHQYDYPGLQPNATVRVTGAKRFVPITQDSDYLIVQNVLAIKYMIQAIESDERNDHQGADAFEKKCVSTLQAEVKKYQADPTNSLKRKADYDADLVNYKKDTFGYTRARLAFELPNALSMGKSELTRLLEQAEMGLMDKIQAIGTIQEYEAQVTSDLSILCPKEVEAIIATKYCGQPLTIKNMFFNYLKHGHRWWSGVCLTELRDEGEIRDSDGDLRRQYRLVGGDATTAHTFKFIAALRWVKKSPTDYMTIRNFEALRLKCSSILHQKAERYQEAIADEQMAIDQLDKEIRRFLGGQLIVPSTDYGIWSHRRFHAHRL